MVNVISIGSTIRTLILCEVYVRRHAGTAHNNTLAIWSQYNMSKSVLWIRFQIGMILGSTRSESVIISTDPDLDPAIVRKP
jgi:hypothetical protein